MQPAPAAKFSRFYPRHPRGWRLRPCRRVRPAHRGSFYPRHPRGWRLSKSLIPADDWIVSIHATLAGGDSILQDILVHYAVFLSTPPSRVATAVISVAVLFPAVSIHATLAGGDPRHRWGRTRSSRFYPRHPRGWRPHNVTVEFQATAVSIHATLAGGDTGSSTNCVCIRKFLSTPPSRVATELSHTTRRFSLCFYPRHPRGWRRYSRDDGKAYMMVSIHATLAGGDFDKPLIDNDLKAVSIHATLAGGDTMSRLSS